jgi:hypothetical protein
MKKLIFTSLVFISFNCVAQTTADIETDRPDQTETPFSVGKHKFQAENGYSVWKSKSNITNYNAVSLLRYGLHEKFELRAEIANDVNNNEFTQFHEKGWLPLELGFKANLFEEKGWLPKTSLIAHLTLPKAASNIYKGNHLATNFRFTSQHTIGKKQSLSYNLGGEWSTYDKSFTPLYTLATGYDFSNFLYGYLELFGFFPKNQKAEHTIAGGFAFLVKPNVQFDISGGIGITPTATKNYWAMGLSFRIPN